VRFVSREGESIYNLRGWQGPRLILNFEDKNSDLNGIEP
jgi:hypothetical protein